MLQYSNVFNHYHRIKNLDTYKAFGCILQPSSVWRHLWMVLEMIGNANGIHQTGPPCSGVPSSMNLSLIMLFQIGGRFYHPPPLLSEGFKSWMCIASLTPLFNPLCSTNSVFVFSNVMVWLGLSVCMYFETSDVVKLSLLCSPNLAFSESSVSQHKWLHIPHS